MDITKTRDKITFSNLFNAQIVNYSVIYAVGLLIFIVLKQILKHAIGLSGELALPIAFAITSVLSFITERKIVFVNGVRASKIQQIYRFVFKTAVDVGIFFVLKFTLCDMLGAHYTIPFVLSAILFYFFNLYFDRLIVFDSIAKCDDNSNSRIYAYFFNNRYVYASAILALACIGFVYAIFKLFPFGDMTVLRMDLYHQYGPLFVELYDRLTNFESFIYSWQSGGGSSFLGNYFNYLSSPLSLLILLFDRNQIGYAITSIVALKGILSAASFTYYLKRSLNRHSFASACFGVFYAFSGYFLAYYWNVMWLDGMMLLPLIALGIEQIINASKSKTYILSLALLLYSNYYMGYMACIFSVVYFLVYFCANYDLASKITIKAKRNNIITKLFSNRFFATGVRFALSSLTVGMLCAFFLIPVYNILQACSATSDNFPTEFKSYFDLLNLISQHLAGLETTIRSSGDDVLPNIYCSILAVLLVPLYLINEKISLKEKISYILALVFFVFSFDNNIANFVWHALHFPNDLPYRFSYMYVFIFLVISFKGLMNIDKIKYRDIMATGILAIFVILILQKFPTNKMSEYTIYISLAFAMIWTLVLLVIKKDKLSKAVVGIMLVCITFSECIVADSSGYLFTQSQSDYVENMATYGNAVEYIEDNDDGFYRTELTRLNTRLDPCIYGYDGMSTFSSMAYEAYSGTQNSLGMYSNKINSYTYNTQTPIYNMFYNIKYLIEAKGTNLSSNYYTKIHTTEDIKATQVYKNDYYLPIAFSVMSDLDMWYTGEGDPFEVQESLIDNAAGVSNVFVPVEYVSTQSSGAECENITSNGLYSISAPENNVGGEVKITVRAVTNSNMYVYIKSPNINNIEYSWNNNESTASQSCNEPYIFDLGRHDIGDEVEITLDTGGLTNGGTSLKIYAYCIDEEVLNSAYEMLKLGQLNVTEHSDTTIKGDINAGFDGYLYTSIPYDEGWSIYIDGQKQEIFALGDSQLCCEISAGSHEVVMKYRPRGMLLGASISIATVLCLTVFIIIKRRHGKKPEQNTHFV